jgi:signal transduction histidine kinase
MGTHAELTTDPRPRARGLGAEFDGMQSRQRRLGKIGLSSFHHHALQGRQGRLAGGGAIVFSRFVRCMATTAHSHPLRNFAWLWTGRHAAVKIQTAAAFLIITLLNTGYYWQGALRALTTRVHPPNVVSLWDGFEWYTWLIAAPATLLLIRRCPLVRGQMARSITRLALGSITIYLVVANVRFLLRMLPNIWLPDERDLPWNWLTYLHTQLTLAPIDFLTFGGIFASSFAIDYYVQYLQRTDEAHELELRATRLQSELALAQLATLCGQLQPHFLFNAFNAIATLVRQQKNEVAVEMIAQLSALLRLTMEDTGLLEVSLERELDFALHYLAVERIRFGDKLNVEVKVAPDALPALVPRLLLQPLAENAVKHAISRRTTAGTIHLSARRQGNRLVLEIADDGPGESPGPPAAVRTGVGLANTRARLEAVYRNDFQMELLPRPEGGMLVRLDLPWRMASVPAESSAIPA